MLKARLWATLGLPEREGQDDLGSSSLLYLFSALLGSCTSGRTYTTKAALHAFQLQLTFPEFSRRCLMRHGLTLGALSLVFLMGGAQMLGAHLVLSCLCSIHAIQPLCTCWSAKPQAIAGRLVPHQHKAGVFLCLRVHGSVRRRFWHGSIARL